MPRDTRALKIIEDTAQLMKHGYVSKRPGWFDSVVKNPPTHASLLKTVNTIQYERISELKNKLMNNNKSLKNKNLKKNNFEKKLYKPPKIIYEEDKIRDRFYKEHPWELARPKILIESMGDDFNRMDWSTIRQDRKQLDGESVVHRTLWLKNNVKNIKNISEAYDIARFEFYKLRMSQEIEKRIAAEEACFFGAVFESDPLELALEREQIIVDDWAEKVEKAAMIQSGTL